MYGIFIPTFGLNLLRWWEFGSDITQQKHMGYKPRGHTRKEETTTNLAGESRICKSISKFEQNWVWQPIDLMNLSEKTAGKHIPFYLTFRNPFRFFVVVFSGWKNVFQRSSTSGFPEVKANVRIVGCAIHHFPSDKDDTAEMCVPVGFLVAVFWGAKMPFSRGHVRFFLWKIGDPPKKNKTWRRMDI